MTSPITPKVMVFHPTETKISKVSHKEIQIPERRNSEGITNPLQTFFNFIYYSCICPTRFIIDPGSKLFYGKQWLPQKVK